MCQCGNRRVLLYSPDIGMEFGYWLEHVSPSFHSMTDMCGGHTILATLLMHKEEQMRWWEHVNTLYSKVTFNFNCANYTCTGCPAEASCQANWNKLWGKSRCGFLNPHHIGIAMTATIHHHDDHYHQHITIIMGDHGINCVSWWHVCIECEWVDSDRFAWRRHLTMDNQIELAAYSYDKGVKPYPDNPKVNQGEDPTHEPQWGWIDLGYMMDGWFNGGGAWWWVWWWVIVIKAFRHFGSIQCDLHSSNAIGSHSNII